jgi:hypothetical protein
MHFTIVTGCFYFGLFGLSHAGTASPGKIGSPSAGAPSLSSGEGRQDVYQGLLPFWMGLLAGFAFVLISGWEQHFGGLEETRRYFYMYKDVLPEFKDMPPEYLKKIASNRIFATLFYPNTLAGAILLFLPPLLTMLWQLRKWLTAPARGFLVGSVGFAALACLYWSGSKGGWLLMLLLGLIVLLRMPMAKHYKVALITIVLIGGLAGFFLKYAGFFKKGATSVSARFDYWQAALKITANRPLFGTGPGTFGPVYTRIKRPESEPARLTHNDYLEQASDSGIPGFLAYIALMGGVLAWSYKKTRSPMVFAVWLGVLGWSLQGFMEFGLYIPALAWPAFALLGWLLGVEELRAGLPEPQRT